MLILILLLATNVYSGEAKSVLADPPAKGTAAAFLLNIIKTSKTMSVKETEKHFTDGVKFLAKSFLEGFNKTTFSKESLYKEMPKENGFILVSIKYLSEGEVRIRTYTTKKIGGEWKFAHKNMDKDKK